MESLADTLWDVVIYGTGLKQSLLALSLSRSGKNILHLDPNNYYGGPEAALSLSEAEVWAADASALESSAFQNVSVNKPSTEGQARLSSPRQYSIALAPQFVHSRSALVSQLVSSRAYRQVEFLAVGSFFILKRSGDADAPTLTRIPSTREDVFSTTAIPPRAKRSLMKFLKFVLEQTNESDQNTSELPDISVPWAEKPLAEFLQSEFKLDQELQAYILALTLSLDAKVSTKNGLNAIRTHLNSMGVFGPGFAAVYPKWGGLSEIAQVGCRACAVGGAVYMLGTDIKQLTELDSGDEKLEIELTTGEKVKAKLLVRDESSAKGTQTISRLVAIASSPLKSLFTPTVEGAPPPAVAVTAFPPGVVKSAGEKISDHPVFASIHSSDTGECPTGQSIIYLTTAAHPESKDALEAALSMLLSAVEDEQPAQALFQMYYEQSATLDTRATAGRIGLPGPLLTLAFDDAVLDSVREAWRAVMGPNVTAEDEADFMMFTDREGANDDDDVYD